MTKLSYVWGPFFAMQPRVVCFVCWKGDLARPKFIWGVESETRHWAA